MDKESFLLKMDEYIDGLLSAEESEEFSIMLNQYNELYTEFMIHKQLRSKIKAAARKEFKKELHELQQNNAIQKSKPNNSLINLFLQKSTLLT